MEPTESITPRLAVVVPCYNEEAVLPDTTERLLKVLDELAAEGLATADSFLLYVNDGSTDRTWATIRALHEQDGRTRGLLLSANGGQQQALLAGMEAAYESADVTITIDADLQDDIRTIPAMLRYYREGCDIVYGVRRDRHVDPWLKRTTAAGFYMLLKLMGGRCIFNHADFRLMSREAFRQLPECNRRWLFLRGLVPYVDLPSACVYYDRRQRLTGETKYSYKSMTKLAFKGIMQELVLKKHLLWLLVLFTVFFFFVCEESPMHDLFNPRGNMPRVDSCWFFTCGKAWMNGLTPYVDFTDSKGPLLWLLHGLAYLLTPTSYVGVFLVVLPFYWVTVAFLYKTFRLFVRSSSHAFWLTLVLVPLLFLPTIHVETRCEDFALTFIVVGIYYTCRLLFLDNIRTADFRRTAFLLGVGMGATLLIKYSMSVIFAVPFLFTCYRAWQCRQNLWRLVAWTAAGALAMVLPFVIYFAIIGNLQAFVNEYFLRTFYTIGEIKQGHGDRTNYWDYLPMVTYVAMLTVCSLSAALWLKRFRLFPFFAFLGFLLPHIFYVRLYYFNTCHGFLVFGLLTTYFMVSQRKQWPKVKTALCILVLLATAIPYLYYNAHYTAGYFYHPQRRGHGYQYAEQLLPKHKPTIVYWHCADVGIGLLTEALPYCKYYSQQVGVTPQMVAEQDAEVMKGKADFVIVAKGNAPLHEALRKMGYKLCPEIDNVYQIFYK